MPELRSTNPFVDAALDYCDMCAGNGRTAVLEELIADIQSKDTCAIERDPEEFISWITEWLTGYLEREQ